MATHLEREIPRFGQGDDVSDPESLPWVGDGPEPDCHGDNPDPDTQRRGADAGGADARGGEPGDRRPAEIRRQAPARARGWQVTTRADAKRMLLLRSDSRRDRPGLNRRPPVPPLLGPGGGK